MQINGGNYEIDKHVYFIDKRVKQVLIFLKAVKIRVKRHFFRVNL